MPNRVRNHVLEEVSLAHLRREFPNSWVIHPYGRDYGIDIQVEVFTESGNATGIRFYGQVKATDRDEHNDLLRLDRAHLKYWASHSDPVILLRYFDKTKQLRWCWLNDVHWRLKPEHDSLDVAKMLLEWKSETSVEQIQGHLEKRRAALFEPLVPPFRLSVDSKGSTYPTELLSAQISSILKSKSITVSPQDSGAGHFQVTVSDSTIACSYVGLPGFTVDCEEDFTVAEAAEHCVLAIFLCACKYERLVFARSLATLCTPILYRVAGEPMRLTILDLIIFALGLVPAIEVIKKTLSNEPNSEDAWPTVMTAAASAAWRYGEVHSWIELMRRWVKQPPISENSSAFAYNLGNALSQQSEWEGAIEAFHMALDSDVAYRSRAYIWTELGAANFEAGHLTIAAECYEKALAIEASPEHSWRLADALFHLGQYDKAQTYLLSAKGDLTSRQTGYVALLLDVINELSGRWNLQRQELSHIDETHHQLLQAAKGKITEEDAISLLGPTLQLNALDGRFNFNAGVYLSRIGHHSLALYRFLSCALVQRWDGEAWINSMFCALNAHDPALMGLIAQSAHLHMGAEFLPWLLGQQKGFPDVPEKFKEIWEPFARGLVDSLQREKEASETGPTMRVHGTKGTKEYQVPH